MEKNDSKVQKNDRENRAETNKKDGLRRSGRKEVIVRYTGIYTDLIRKRFSEKNIMCSDDQIGKFSDYMEGLLQWNEAINLTNIIEPGEFIDKHYIDSLSLSNSDIYNSSDYILDLGTGAGFPGIPLAIASPDKEFVLLETIGKKVKVVKQLVDDIGIDNATVIKARAEDLGRDRNYREKFDLVVSRAVADMAVLSEYCLPFVKVGGYFIAYKTDRSDEIDRATRAINLLGGKLISVEESGIEGAGHTFAIVKKIKHTGGKFPRQAGKPGREPIL